MLTTSARYYTVKDTALVLDLSPRTVLRYINDGTLKAVTYQRPQRNTYRVYKSSVKQFQQQQRAAS